MANNKILSYDEIETISHYLANFKKSVEYFCNQYDKVINSFESNDVVKSFYESGNYGLTLKEDLQKIRKVMNDYFNVIVQGEDSLYSKTHSFLNSQQELLNSKRSHQIDAISYGVGGDRW